jgi:predicted dehydrogenase
MDGEIRVAQVGVQGHCEDVLGGVPKISKCRLVAAAKSFPGENLSRIRLSSAWSKDARVYDDYRKMLDEVRPDIVTTFAPYAANGGINIEAVTRGCHVFSEKPVAASVAELDALRAARDRQKVQVTAMLNMRTFPAFVAARDAVRQGRIGEPVLLAAQKSYQWGPSRPDYYKKRETYGGSFPWVAIHAIDFMRFVSGLDFASVTALQAVKGHPGYPECEDCGAALFGMANGGQGALTFDYFRPRKATSHGDDRLRVVGTKGIVEVRLTNKPFCELMTDDSLPAQLPLPESEVNMFVGFVESLRTGKPHVLTSDDALRATEVAIKARDSADTRKTIPLA